MVMKSEIFVRHLGTHVKVNATLCYVANQRWYFVLTMCWTLPIKSIHAGGHIECMNKVSWLILRHTIDYLGRIRLQLLLPSIRTFNFQC